LKAIDPSIYVDGIKDGKRMGSSRSQWRFSATRRDRNGDLVLIVKIGAMEIFVQIIRIVMAI
jgi:hypothetical protein